MADKPPTSDSRGEVGASALLPAPAAETAQGGLFDDLRDEGLPLRKRGGLGIGRAPGVRNRRTEAMRDLYLRLGYSHPMLWLGEVLTRSVHELARELQCKPVEALAEQRKAAADLLPYMESRQPLNIHDDRERSPNVLIVGDVTHAVKAARQARADGAMAIDDDVLDAVAEHVTNQGVSGDGLEASHGDPSHDGTQALDVTPQSDLAGDHASRSSDPPSRDDDGDATP
jgi:hypothetical protein